MLSIEPTKGKISLSAENGPRKFGYAMEYCMTEIRFAPEEDILADHSPKKSILLEYSLVKPNESSFGELRIGKANIIYEMNIGKKGISRKYRIFESSKFTKNGSLKISIDKSCSGKIYTLTKIYVKDLR